MTILFSYLETEQFRFLHKHRTHGTANDAELVGGSDQIERVLT